MKPDDTLYEVLEVSPRARSHVIRAAYRCLVQHHHPDKNAGDEIANERLARINHAYAILSDPVKRLDYDRRRGAQDSVMERRGTRVDTPGCYSQAAAGHQVSRPFGFRPL